MLGVRSLSGYLALVASIVVAVAASVWLTASDEAKVVIVVSVAGPTVLVAVLGPAFRLAPVLAAAAVAYAVWFCFVARDQADVAAENVLGALRLWPVIVAWGVAGVLVVLASVSAIRIANRRARRAERRARNR